MNNFGTGVNSAVNHLRATTNQWYHPYISRAEGAQLLEGCEAGSFILRESSKGGSYALSVVLPNSGALGHYLVEKRGPECFCLQGSENSFSTIEELLAHYHHHDSIGLPCRLRLPQRHSSSISYSSRPSLPPLPPRNNSRAGAVGRPTGRPKAHSPGPPAAAAPSTSATSIPTSGGGGMGRGMAKPHLDPRRPYNPNEMASSFPTHQGGHAHQQHVAGPHSPHLPRPNTAPPASSIPPSHLKHVDGGDEDGETYEDMNSSLKAAASTSAHAHIPQDEMDGETYEDMAVGGRNANAAAAGFGANAAAADVDEFGETYEDMAAGGLAAAQAAAHAAAKAAAAQAAAHAAAKAAAAQAAAKAPAEEEFCQDTYEDMAAHAVTKAPPVEEFCQDTYEDMASVSPNMK